MPIMRRRRGPHVSDYIATLNTIPTVDDLAAQRQEKFDMDHEFDLLTNLNFDLPPMPDISIHGECDSTQDHARRLNVSSPSMHSPKMVDFSNANFGFSNRSNYTGLVDVDPISTPNQPSYSIPNIQTSDPSQPSPLQSTLGEKRRNGSILCSHPDQPVDISMRLAAEEDKRRRNTAASARFRVKKKQREQAMEKSAKDMNEKVTLLEARVSQLEMENKWLKGLITEKNDSKIDIQELYQKFTREAEDARRTTDGTDGVGTRSAKEILQET